MVMPSTRKRKAPAQQAEKPNGQSTLPERQIELPHAAAGALDGMSQDATNNHIPPQIASHVQPVNLLLPLV